MNASRARRPAIKRVRGWSPNLIVRREPVEERDDDLPTTVRQSEIRALHPDPNGCGETLADLSSEHETLIKVAIAVVKDDPERHDEALGALVAAFEVRPIAPELVEEPAPDTTPDPVPPHHASAAPPAPVRRVKVRAARKAIEPRALQKAIEIGALQKVIELRALRKAIELSFYRALCVVDELSPRNRVLFVLGSAALASVVTLLFSACG